MNTYRKKTSPVTAIQWDGELDRLPDFLDGFEGTIFLDLATGHITITSNELTTEAPVGVWLIRTVENEIEMLSDVEFKNQYEPAI